MRNAIFALGALAVFAGSASAGPAGLAGSWSGEMRQIETNTEATYPMTLTFSGKGALADYPTLNCSGLWSKVTETNGYAVYAEKAVNRNGATCVDGIVMVSLHQGRVFLGWFAAFDGAPTVATAVLSKAAE